MHVKYYLRVVIFMPRNKTLEDKTYIRYIDNYIDEKCNGNPNTVKMESLARYITEKEGKNIKGYLLRRNDALRNHLNDLKKLYNEKPINILSSIKIKELSEISNSCPDYESMLSELIRLHNTCKQLMIVAKSSLIEIRKLEKQNITLKDKFKITSNEYSQKCDECKKLKKSNKNLLDENYKIKNYIKKYVNPEIASAILNEIGISNELKIVDKENIEKNLVDADTEIFFDRTKDNDVNSIIELFGSNNDDN